MPMGIPEKTFGVKDKIAFDPSKLDINCGEKKLMTEAVFKMFKKNRGYFKLVLG